MPLNPFTGHFVHPFCQPRALPFPAAPLIRGRHRLAVHTFLRAAGTILHGPPIGCALYPVMPGYGHAVTAPDEVPRGQRGTWISDGPPLSPFPVLSAGTLQVVMMDRVSISPFFCDPAPDTTVTGKVRMTVNPITTPALRLISLIPVQKRWPG